MTVDGLNVIEGAVTQTGGGSPAFTAFRQDVIQAIASGDLGKTLGNLGINAANILGHEGTHLWGSSELAAYAVKWGFKP